MRFVLIALIAATAPAALAQGVNTPPRTAEGIPISAAHAARCS